MNTNGLHGLLAALIVTGLLHAAAAAATRYVDGLCGDDRWSGASPICEGPNGPKRTIQAAIDVAFPGDTILVAPGIYRENVDLDKELTIRSVDPGDPAVVSATVIDGGQSGSVVTCTDQGPDTVMSGLTITNGTAMEGGGMRIDNASPTVVNCRFVANVALDDGGGIKLVAGSSPTIAGCLFHGNQAPDGGGLACTSSSDPVVSDCRFVANVATFNGGGMATFSGSQPVVVSCLFAANEAGGAGGAMVNIFPPVIASSTFCANAPNDILGSWTNGGANAFLEDCVEPPGACCLPEAGGCADLSETACTALAGTWQGVFTVCTPASCDLAYCPSDTNGDGIVNTVDLVNVILAWGTDDPDADVNDDGLVDVADLTAVLLDWGDC